MIMQGNKNADIVHKNFILKSDQESGFYAR